LKVTLDSSVLVRAFLQKSSLAQRHGLSDSDIYEYVLLQKSLARLAEPDPLLLTPIRDPEDAVVIQTAIAGGADIICTVDRDFYSPPADAFLRSVELEMLSDVELAQRLKAQ